MHALDASRGLVDTLGSLDRADPAICERDQTAREI